MLELALGFMIPPNFFWFGFGKNIVHNDLQCMYQFQCASKTNEYQMKQELEYTYAFPYV